MLTNTDGQQVSNQWNQLCYYNKSFKKKFEQVNCCRRIEKLKDYERFLIIKIFIKGKVSKLIIYIL